MNGYVMETRQVTKTYGSFLALDHVNIHVRKGCIYGLVGDNGAGKSTLLKLLAGQSFPTKGEIEILGKHGLKDLENVRKQMGCMIEQPGFFPNMTVEQTLKYYCIQKGIPDKGRILEEAHLKVEADLPSHPLWIMGNQPALERIFLNMFQNGGRYAESIFQIAVKEENQEIFISFTNDTKKLSPEDLPRLFDRFYIQDSARSQGGTGLGLTVARSLAEEMGGTLEVSAPELPEKEETQNLIVCFELKFKVWDFL